MFGISLNFVSLPEADLPFITVAFLCRSGYRWIQGRNVFTVALQHSVLVTAGFKLPIMQRSLIHEVSQVSSPCQHIHPSQWPPAMLTWSNGHCRLMLISPHHTWQLNQGVEICGCHPSWVCFRPYCHSGLDSKAHVLERGIIHLLRIFDWCSLLQSLHQPG